MGAGCDKLGLSVNLRLATQINIRVSQNGWLKIHSLAKTTSNFKTHTMSLVSALDKNDDLESLDNSSENSATVLETGV